MSKNASLRALLARLEHIPDESPPPSGSAVGLRLTWAGDIRQIRTISAIRALVLRGVTVLRAKRAIEALLVDKEVFLEAPAVDSLDTLAADLADAGVAATPALTGPVDVRQIRERLGLTQEQFALRFGLDLDAVRNWEHGRRTPDLAARLYLRVIDAAPGAVLAALWR
ncbi:MAG: helix-turn-helix domain-containing protein, partial [Proteobacteria bacterium]|nr:helix-turn-helix domain-containing protein [Pseudomonadota bacterium]